MATQAICETCGREFVFGAGSKGRFCCRACYWQSLQQRKPHNYDPITLCCATCGKSFTICRYRLGTAMYCSTACRGKARTLTRPKVTRTCTVCGKQFDILPSQARIREARYCSQECHGVAARGENSPTWKGGRFPYYGGNWKQQRDKARARDGHRCQVCGISESELTYRLHAHHIVPRREFNGSPESANDLNNLICLCRSCHRKVETGVITLQP